MDALSKKDILLHLFSPTRLTRLHQLENLIKDNTPQKAVYEILLAIENVPPTITEFRERERYLENLINQIAIDKSVLSEESHLYILAALTGSLYVNFEKFWGPTIHKLIDIINSSKCQRVLVNQLVDHLKDTNDLIYTNDSLVEPESAAERHDHILHRNFIFQILAKFSHHVEAQSSVFMDELFRFVRRELMVSPFLEKVTRSSLFEQILDKPSIQNGAALYKDGDTTTQEKTKRKKVQKRGCKHPITKELMQKRKSRETFVTVSKVIQSFLNISRVHRQTELKVLILDLLCCRDSSIQRAAFNCLLAFDQEPLRPYTERLLKILNDKSARTAITMLSNESEQDEKIKPEDRPTLMPVLLRIVFGKMIGRIGKKSSGRNKAELRKNIVMRFIACCEADEIGLFFQFLFDPLYLYLEVDYLELASTIDQQINYENFVPLNKLQAMISSLSTYMESVANLKPETLVHVLKLINITLYHVMKPLEDDKIILKISAKNLESLKILRRTCMNAITQFFQSFTYYNYQQSEIEFIFEHLVWASARGFIDRNHAAVTPLLRFIQVLASSRAYHKLLLLTNKCDNNKFLLEYIIELYNNEKTTRPISKELAAILADLINPDRNLNLEEDHELGDLCDTSVNCVLVEYNPPMPKFNPDNYDLPANLEYSHRMLIGYTDIILNRLTKVCTDFISKKDSESRIEKDELFILSTLSSYLKDSEQSLRGVRLLLTSLMYQKSKDLILSTLKAIQDLLKNVNENTDPYIVPILADIFSYQRDITQRSELCLVLRLLSGIDKNLESVSTAITLLNTTRDDLVEQPDIARWNDGFQKAFEYLDSLSVCIDDERAKIAQDSIVLLVHQVGFIINSVDRYEFSIRDNCLTFHEKLAKIVGKINPACDELLRFLTDELILEKFIKKGLRETNELVRHSYLGVLRSWALHCHEQSSTLQEFHLFCSNQDDLDLWINIRHIQLHNRSRALARLIASENLHKVSPKTLSGYFLPIASGFLFNKNYKSVSSLAENSIKLIGLICRQLNWITYESTLNFYLDQLIKAKTTYQKTSIKLITEILKNFNFDLSACEEAQKNREEDMRLEKRMRNRISAGVTNEVTDPDVVPTDAPCGKKLNPSTAKMVYNSVTKRIIPRLSSCLHEMTRSEFEHDKNMANYLPEKEEVKRIPMAYAIVQLLNLLPGKYLLFRDQLPIIFLKMTSFLRSKNEQIRKVARVILIKVMSFVGPAYMPDLIRILKQNLDKGFYIHVLNFTLHSVLDKIPLFYGCLDNCIDELLKLCFHEIFGRISEDKEVAQVLAKTSEAKKTKSYDTLLIIATHVSSAKLVVIMDHIKKELVHANEPKRVSKLSNCIQKVFTGLSKNDDFPTLDLINFIQVSIEDSIPSLKVRAKVDQADIELNQKFSLREDRFLITKDLSRDRVKSKINEKGNLHMVVENSLRLLLHVLEKNKATIVKGNSYEDQLDKLVKLLTTCLNSSSPRCVMRALKCISFIAQSKSDLSYLQTRSGIIVRKIFILLSMYNGVGMAQGENSEMIAMCFRSLTHLIVRCKQVKLEESQLRALISYVEQDLYDVNRQITAFGILNSLLDKKYYSHDIDDIMRKVGDLLVTSEDDSIRKSSVKLWQIYLLEYKHEGRTLQAHLTKFLRQLDYEFIDGRKSVLSMLEVVLTKFPESILRNYYELTFHLLSQRLINEDSSEVRDQVGKLIGIIIRRLHDKQLYLFNKFVSPWALNENIQIKLLGVKLMSVFIEVEDKFFKSDKSRVQTVLEVISGALKNDPSSIEEEEAARKETIDDRLPTIDDKLSYHALRLFRRLLIKRIILPTNDYNTELTRNIWQLIANKKLSEYHFPTVLVSSQLYLLFLKDTTTIDGINLTKIIARTLADNFIDLLDKVPQQGSLLPYLSENLLLLGRIVANTNATLDFEKAYLANLSKDEIGLEHQISQSGFVDHHLPYRINEAKRRVDLFWLSTKVVMQARKEAALYRLKEYHRREFVLKWIAAIAKELGPARIQLYATLFMMPPLRELTDKFKSSSNLSILAEDLLKYFKGLMGEKLFNSIYSAVQLHYTKKRIDRKKWEAMIRVTDQVRGIKRKKDLSDHKRERRKIRF